MLWASGFTDDAIFGKIETKFKQLTNYDRPKYIHLFPHSHTDVGWLGTIDQYFNGLDFYGGSSVNLILSTVVQELQKDPNKTFVYAEIKFFRMWWAKQDDLTKSNFRKLV